MSKRCFCLDALPIAKPGGRLKAVTSLVGMEQSAIHMCARLPTGTVKDGHSEIWSYERATSTLGGREAVSFDILRGVNIGNPTLLAIAEFKRG